MSCVKDFDDKGDGVFPIGNDMVMQQREGFVLVRRFERALSLAQEPGHREIQEGTTLFIDDLPLIAADESCAGRRVANGAALLEGKSEKVDYI